jgi:hypothetical protein
MNNTDAAAYYRSRAMRYRLLADQAGDTKLAALYRELASAFEREADRRDGGSSAANGQSG